jgi:hypothetical protein
MQLPSPGTLVLASKLFLFSGANDIVLQCPLKQASRRPARHRLILERLNTQIQKDATEHHVRSTLDLHDGMQHHILGGRFPALTASIPTLLPRNETAFA